MDLGAYANIENLESIIDPCKACQIRKIYVRYFDMHFCGDDCPYDCKEWDAYKKERNVENNEQK